MGFSDRLDIDSLITDSSPIVSQYRLLQKYSIMAAKKDAMLASP